MAWPNVTFEGGAATYYLKETRAPAGCDINDTVIPVKVGVYSIYADAGTPDDNVSVSAGVGKLTQTMVQYASEGDVNITRATSRHSRSRSRREASGCRIGKTST